LFDQFKENLSLAGDFAGTVHDGLKSAPTAWRKATPETRTAWLAMPAIIIVTVVAEHFSARWYYEAAAMVLIAVVIELWMRRANGVRTLVVLLKQCRRDATRHELPKVN